MTSEPKTWEEGCRNAADVILGHYSPTAKGYPDIPRLRKVLDNLNNNRGYASLAANALHGVIKTACAVYNMTSGEGAISGVCAILAQKQHDYGHENITRFGLQGIVVRLSDKIARLENLTRRDTDPQVEESLLDTWRDIVGYCIIALMVIDGTFELELEVDQPKVVKPTYLIDWLNHLYIVENGVTRYLGLAAYIDEREIRDQIQRLKRQEGVK